MIELKKCPICGEAPKLIGGPENWSPTFYDPDSGGDPCSIICECGLSLNIGMSDPEQLKNLWNTRTAAPRFTEEEREAIEDVLISMKIMLQSEKINFPNFHRERIEKYEKNIAILRKMLAESEGGVEKL